MTGIVVVDKPADWTSHDVVAKLRGRFHEKRIGHGGTLDPMATGVLPVFLGRATRAVEFLENADKEYVAEVRFGLTTDTQDTTGNVLTQREAHPAEAEIAAVLASFQGPCQQLPPMYSAIKIGGKKLYELARKGKEVERQPRSIHLFELEPLGYRENGDFRFRLVCSKGTYVRTVCSDLGEKLGCGGAMSYLRRTRAGAYPVNEAIPLSALLEDGGERYLRPVDSIFRAYPALTVSGEAERRCRNGNPLDMAAADGKYRLYNEDGAFLALVQASGGTLTTIKSFFEVD